MDFGLAVVGMRGPGIGEIIQDQVNDLLCETEVDSVRAAI
jgi:hypothetical protein